MLCSFDTILRLALPVHHVDSGPVTIRLCNYAVYGVAHFFTVFCYIHQTTCDNVFFSFVLEVGSSRSKTILFF